MDRLEKAMRDRGMRVSDLARISGISDQTIYGALKSDKGSDRLGVSTFAKLAQALGMTIDELYEYGERERSDYAYVKIPPMSAAGMDAVKDYAEYLAGRE